MAVLPNKQGDLVLMVWPSMTSNLSYDQVSEGVAEFKKGADFIVSFGTLFWLRSQQGYAEFSHAVKQMLPCCNTSY